MRHFIETKARGKLNIYDWGFLDDKDDNTLPQNEDDSETVANMVNNLSAKLRKKK